MVCRSDWACWSTATGLAAVVAIAVCHEGRAQVNVAERRRVWRLEGAPSPALDVEVLSAETQDGVRVEEIYFTSEVAHGAPVRVYGFLASPLDVEGPLPCLVQLHGGGGTARRAGAAGSCRALGAYVLSIDWSADPDRAERVTVADSLGDPRLFGDPRYVADDLSDFAARHVVTAIRRSVDVLLAQPDADPQRVAVMGGSWGGFLALLASEFDPRVRWVVSGFGAGGFRDTYSLCARPLYSVSEAQREFWLTYVDPVRGASRIGGPVALLTASNELHFWLSSAVATFGGLPEGSRLIISPNTVHATGAGVIWPNHEWFRTCFGEGPPWPEVLDFHFDGHRATWRVVAPRPLVQTRLYFAPGAEHWPGRVWLPIPARPAGEGYEAVLPGWLEGSESDAYPLVTDDLRRSVSAVPLHVVGHSPLELSERRSDPGLVDDFAAGVGLWRLTLAARGKATLTASDAGPGGRACMVLHEHRGEAARVAVETNLITLAASRLRAAGALCLQLDTAGQALDLDVELTENPGERDERRFTTSTPLEAESGWQAVRIPLAEFRRDRLEPDWPHITRLGLAWSLPAGCTVRVSDVRID